MIHPHLFQGKKRAVCVEKCFRCNMLERHVSMFVFAVSVALTEKLWLSLSFNSISTPKWEPFIEDCYRRFFYNFFLKGLQKRKMACRGIIRKRDVATGIRVSEAHKLYHEKNRPVAADFINKLLPRENKWELK